MARTGVRAAAIIIKNDKILLMHRKKDRSEYWVFPGGGVEDDETGEKTIVREIKEETGLKCTKIKLAFVAETYEGGNKHPFYFCEVDGDKVTLGGPEAEKQSEEDWYSPEWVKLGEVKNLNLLPESAKAKLLKIIQR